ncbi:uncharacterized protein METZ01_LOCUS230877 [marine metagenome]|uniref:Uncharacterized protein n=1 Tax=marine metagenome TaxID=408172 RepID=A0A382GU02_9ZZZZ
MLSKLVKSLVLSSKLFFNFLLIINLLILKSSTFKSLSISK